MKSWQIALLVVVLVVGGVLVFKSGKTVPKTSQAPKTSNDLYASLGSLLGGAINKISAPSSNPAPASALGPTSAEFEGGAYNTPDAQRTLSAFDTNNTQVSNGFLYTDDRGNFIAG